MAILPLLLLNYIFQLTFSCGDNTSIWGEGLEGGGSTKGTEEQITVDRSGFGQQAAIAP